MLDREVLSRIPGFVVLLDDAGVILDINRRVPGNEELDLVGRPITEFVAASQHGAVLAALEEARANGDGAALEVRGRLTGRWYKLDLIAAEPPRRERFIALAIDITGRREIRRRSEAAARASERRFKLMADMLPVLISYVDRDERYLFTNALYKLWFGDPVEGRLIREVVGDAAYQAIKPKVDAALDGKAISFEQEVDYAVVGRRCVQADYVPHVEPDGTVAGFFVMVRDLTERRKMEKELIRANKLEAVGRLASGVAHDFNNLLMGIGGAAAVALAKLEPTSEVRELLTEILNSVRSGSGIARQLLALGRTDQVEGGTGHLDAAVARLEPIVRRMLGSNVELRLDLDASGCPIRNVEQMDQVLLNFVVNAKDAMPDGGMVTIATAQVDIDADTAERWNVASGRFVRLTVTDTGTGMDEWTKARLFEPFFTTKGPARGTGLGLATVYGIVGRQGGHVDFHSQVGVGTTFSVYLPVVAAEELPEPTAIQVEPAARRVLVVEDDPLVRRAVRHYLEQGGYAVFEAASAGEARSILADKSPGGSVDLLLADVVLPDQSGPELAREIRAEMPGLRVAFMSAHAPEMLEHIEPPEGPTVWLQKPFDQTLLLEELSALLRS